MTDPVDPHRLRDDASEPANSIDEQVSSSDDDAPIPLSDGIHDAEDLIPLPSESSEADFTVTDDLQPVPGFDEPDEVEDDFTTTASDDQPEFAVLDNAVGEEVTSESDESVPPSMAEEAVIIPPPSTSAASRFGRLFSRNGTKDEESANESASLTGTEDHTATAGSRLVEKVRAYLDPGLGKLDLTWHRRIAGMALALVLVLLVANQAAAALIVASALIPVLIVMILTRYDVFERESNLILAGLGAAGLAVGVVLGSIASWVVGNQWFGGGHLNFGAGGYGGNFASGAAPILVWLVAGLLIPAAMVAGIAAVPIVLRRWPQFANEVMDGVILAGASAAGIAIGLAATFWYPMITGDGPLMSVSDWTLTVLGQVLLRPLVITLSGAMIGAGVWRYMLTSSSGMTAVMPAVGGVLGILLLWFGSIATQSSGIWAEFQLSLLLTVLVFVIYRRTLAQAIDTDTLAMGNDGERIVCSHCHQVTPVGAFCARCGLPLQPVGSPGT